jgi:hypothetical protein
MTELMVTVSLVVVCLSWAAHEGTGLFWVAARIIVIAIRPDAQSTQAKSSKSHKRSSVVSRDGENDLASGVSRYTTFVRTSGPLAAFDVSSFSMPVTPPRAVNFWPAKTKARAPCVPAKEMHIECRKPTSPSIHLPHRANDIMCAFIYGNRYHSRSKRNRGDVSLDPGGVKLCND